MCIVSAVLSWKRAINVTWYSIWCIRTVELLRLSEDYIILSAAVTDIFIYFFWFCRAIAVYYFFIIISTAARYADCRIIPGIVMVIIFSYIFKCRSVIFSRIICSITVRIRYKIINYRLRISSSCPTDCQSHARSNRIDCIYSTIIHTNIFIVAYSWFCRSNTHRRYVSIIIRIKWWHTVSRIVVISAACRPDEKALKFRRRNWLNRSTFSIRCISWVKNCTVFPSKDVLNIIVRIVRYYLKNIKIVADSAVFWTRNLQNSRLFLHINSRCLNAYAVLFI